MSADDVGAPCDYCLGAEFDLVESGGRHKFVPSHGPFDFFRCKCCGAGLTRPLPSQASLDQLYGSYVNGLSEFHRQVQVDDPEFAWHARCVQRIVNIVGVHRVNVSSWADIGAGGGEMARMMARRFPTSRGEAVDQHPRPRGLEDLKGVINWRTIDLNAEDFAGKLAGPFDVVYATGVWEHVMRPRSFASNLLRLVRAGGIVHIVCPDHGSWARKVMGRRWPYYIPGEHLTLPTTAGARLCLRALTKEVLGTADRARVMSYPIWVPYSPAYIFGRFGLRTLARFARRLPAMRLPVGALESVVLVTPRTVFNGQDQHR